MTSHQEVEMAQITYKAPERVDRLASNKVQEELDKLVDEGATELIVDMSELQYISSAGLRVLLTVQQRLGEGGSLILTNVPKTVKDVLDVTGFSGFMNIR